MQAKRHRRIAAAAAAAGFASPNAAPAGKARMPISAALAAACRRLAACAACVAIAALPTIAVPSAHAAEAIASGARLAATCTSCHGTNGATTGKTLPMLAGQPRDTLLASLQAFKAGKRPATIMTQIAKGYSDEQLVQLAAFFAAQAAKPAEGARP